MRNQRMTRPSAVPADTRQPDQPNGVFTLLTAGAFVAALSVAGLAACSDSTAEDPLPLTESDSGVVEPVPEEAPVEDDSMEDGG